MLFMTLTLLITGCKTTVPSSYVIKENLVNKKIYLNYGEILISDVKNIENIKILKKDINKEQRYYAATIEMTVKNDDIILTGTGNVEYTYIPKEGWVMQDLFIDDETVNVEVDNEIDVNTLKSVLKGNVLKFNLKNETIYWEINDTNKITDIKILEITKSDNGFSNKVKFNIKSQNSSEEVCANMNIELAYSLFDHSWHIDNMEIASAKKKLYSGVDKEKLKELLVDQSIYNIIEIDFSDDIIEYDWEIDEESEIKELEIINQDTNLEENKDNIEANITLEKNNLKISTKISINCKYNNGWKIEDVIAIISSADYKLLKEPNLDFDTLNKDLTGESFIYKGYYWGSSWTIEEGELQTANIIDKIPLDYGKNIKFLIDMELKGADKTINGKTFIIYYYDEDSNIWIFKDIEKVGDFEVKK